MIPGCFYGNIGSTLSGTQPFSTYSSSALCAHWCASASVRPSWPISASTMLRLCRAPCEYRGFLRPREECARGGGLERLPLPWLARRGLRCSRFCPLLRKVWSYRSGEAADSRGLASMECLQLCMMELKSISFRREWRDAGDRSARGSLSFSSTSSRPSVLLTPPATFSSSCDAFLCAAL